MWGSHRTICAGRIALSLLILAAMTLVACSENTIVLRARSRIVLSDPYSGIEITYSLQQSAVVTLSIHDQSGVLVRVLVDRAERMGGTSHQVIWHGQNGSAQPVVEGLYYAVLSIPNGRATISLLVQA